MLDSAIAMEAYESNIPLDLVNLAMPPSVDKSNINSVVYNQGCWSTEWYKFWTGVTGDARGALTWRDRFGDIVNKTSITTFYSSTEDVLGAYAGTPTSITLSNAFGIVSNGVGVMGRYAWTLQEKAKGNQFTIPVVTIQGSNYGGWAFNLPDPALTSDPIFYWVDTSFFGRGKRYAVAANAIPDPATTGGADLFRRVPLFDPGYGPNTGATRWVDNSVLRGPLWLPDLFDAAKGNAVAADSMNRSRLLSEAIPALTQPAGANFTAAFESARNINMPMVFSDAGHWPRSVVNGTPQSLHSDMRQVSYVYTYSLYDALVAISNQ